MMAVKTWATRMPDGAHVTWRVHGAQGLHRHCWACRESTLARACLALTLLLRHHSLPSCTEGGFCGGCPCRREEQSAHTCPLACAHAYGMPRMCRSACRTMQPSMGTPAGGSCALATVASGSCCCGCAVSFDQRGRQAGARAGAGPCGSLRRLCGQLPSPGVLPGPELSAGGAWLSLLWRYRSGPCPGVGYAETAPKCGAGRWSSASNGHLAVHDTLRQLEFCRQMLSERSTDVQSARSRKCCLRARGQP